LKFLQRYPKFFTIKKIIFLDDCDFCITLTPPPQSEVGQRTLPMIANNQEILSKRKDNRFLNSSNTLPVRIRKFIV